MHPHYRSPSLEGQLLLAAVLINTAVLSAALVRHPGWYAALALTLPLLGAAIPSYRNHKNPRHMKRFLLRFRELGTRYRLQFSSQEFLPAAALGLDGVHRKLLILLPGGSEGVQSHLIDLDEVRSCSVRKRYGSIRASGLRNRRLEQFLDRITLRFVLHNGEPVEVPFFAGEREPGLPLRALEQKAHFWEILLSKMLRQPGQQRA